MTELLAAVYLIGLKESGRCMRTIATLRRYEFTSMQIVEFLSNRPTPEDI